MTDKEKEAFLMLTDVVNELNEAFKKQNEINENLLTLISRLKERISELEEDRQRKHEEFMKEFRAYLEKKREEEN